MSTLFHQDGNRRHFIASAAKTLLGVGAAPAFLQGLPGTAQAALGPDLGLPDRMNPAKSVIYLYMSGGMTHMDTFDPKPGHENQGPVRSIATSADGVEISEYLPRLATHRLTALDAFDDLRPGRMPEELFHARQLRDALDQARDRGTGS